MSDANLPQEIEALRQAYLSALREWTGEIERLKAENEKLRTALEWYASPEAWLWKEVEGPNGDYGRRARTALQDNSDE